MADVSKLSETVVRQANEITELNKEIGSLEYWRDFSLKEIKSLEIELRESKEQTDSLRDANEIKIPAELEIALSE